MSMFEREIMALTKCTECEKEISSFATVCPNCGFPVQQNGASEETQTTQDKIKNAPDANSERGCAIALLVGIAIVFILDLAKCTGGARK